MAFSYPAGTLYIHQIRFEFCGIAPRLTAGAQKVNRNFARASEQRGAPPPTQQRRPDTTACFSQRKPSKYADFCASRDETLGRLATAGALLRPTMVAAVSAAAVTVLLTVGGWAVAAGTGDSTVISEAACGNSTFPFSRDGVEVVGLRDAKGHAGRDSVAACVAACCTTPGCSIWQWIHNVSDHGHWHAACRLGHQDTASFASPGWIGGGKTKGSPVGPAPPPAPPAPPTPPPPPTIRRGLLSDALGSHMVLQRAPAAAVIWGFSPAGSTVTTTLDSAPALSATADAGGIWRQSLPPTEAGGPHTIHVASSSGATEVLEDVLFGDVYLCGGQSNMAFSMPGITNASYEASLADSYPTVRLFTVGQGTAYQSGRNPLENLLTVEQNWTVASSKSIAQPGAAGIQFGVFSAVCWIFGRTIHDGLGEENASLSCHCDSIFNLISNLNSC
jgi:hypothetical protein